MYKLNQVPDVNQYKMLFLKKLESQALIEKIDAVLITAPQEVIDIAIEQLETEGRIERLQPAPVIP